MEVDWMILDFHVMCSSRSVRMTMQMKPTYAWRVIHTPNLLAHQHAALMRMLLFSTRSHVLPQRNVPNRMAQRDHRRN